MNAISPGPIVTPLYGKLGLSEEALKAVSASLENQVTAKRFGRAGENAKAVVFLASANAALPLAANSRSTVVSGHSSLIG